MSAWYIFSALGFYPVNPVSGEYIIGVYVTIHLNDLHLQEPYYPRPFFDEVTLHLPAATSPLVIKAPNAPHQPYIMSLAVNGHNVNTPIIHHSDITDGGQLSFSMSYQPTTWGSTTMVCDFHDSFSYKSLSLLAGFGLL